MMASTTLFAIFLIVVIVIIMMAIGLMSKNQPARYQPNKSGGLRAQSVINPDKSDEITGISGYINYTETPRGLVIDVDLHGFPRDYQGYHGIHVHESGDLSRGCESAGPHFNPTGEDHGDTCAGHLGDLGNIVAVDGRVNQRIFAPRLSLGRMNLHIFSDNNGGELVTNSIAGRSIIIHANRDDLGRGGDQESKKTGNSGKRIACARIYLC